VTTIRTADITGLVLCGGRGSRMGGADKGLALLHGQPLVSHALARLQGQVGAIAVNANRNLSAYAALGHAVWADTAPDYPGPLAGWLVGMQNATTPYLATVPCDAPLFPLDLVARLAAALVGSTAQLAFAATGAMPATDAAHAAHAAGGTQTQPMFALMQTSLHGELLAYLKNGGRKVQTWVAQQHGVQVLFDDAAAFSNANSPTDLAALHSSQVSHELRAAVAPRAGTPGPTADAQPQSG
jgi:molybdenum cofactor guanylyltransferase